MNGEPLFPSWSAVLQHQAHLLHQQIGATQRLVLDSGRDEMLDKSCQSYYRMLDEIYERDMPVARAIDRSDLLLHLDGEGLQTDSPRLSLVSNIMREVRKQVGAMIKTLVSSVNEAIELPKEIDLGLSSIAHGSLYLGFSLPNPGPGYQVLAGDPLFEASRQALVALGMVSSHCEQSNGYELIQRDFADPKLRDAALSAVGHLAPTGHAGISSMAISGRALKTRASWPTLTPQTRQLVRSWLERPVLSEETFEFRGRVRAIDLDFRRFDLRRIDDGHLPDLRCIYPAELDQPARKWLDTTVTVRGRVETYQGTARLLQVQEVVG
jgi:hypothetical protein